MGADATGTRMARSPGPPMEGRWFDGGWWGGWAPRHPRTVSERRGATDRGRPERAAVSPAETRETEPRRPMERRMTSSA